MARLPQPGGDSGNWGTILNDYLSQSHKNDGTLKNDSVGLSQIAAGAVTTAKLDVGVQTALAKAESAAQPDDVTSAIHSTPGTSSLAAITGRLHRNTENVTMAVLGDSTGNQAFEWVYQTALWLGVKYPAYTVLHRSWNTTSLNYDVATTVSTGTGTKTLTIFNASSPGELATYSTPKLAAQLPVAPHAVIISYGHNSSSATARPDNYALVRAIRESFPFTAIIMTAQNPRAQTDSDYNNGILRQQSNIDLAQSEGLGIINVMQAFLDNSNYATDWLDPDGLHPNAAGMQIWRNEVIKHFRDDSVTVPRGAYSDNISEIWIPASNFIAKSTVTAPVRVDTHDLGPYWTLPATGTSSIHTQFAVPPSWDHLNLYAKWMQIATSGFTAGNNVIRAAASVRGFGAPGYNNAPSTAATTGLTSIGTVNVVANNNAGGVGVKTSNLGFTRPIGYGLGNIMALEIKRFGDDVSDTNTEEWRLLGIMAIRQS